MLQAVIDKSADLHFPMIDNNSKGDGRFHMLFVARDALKQNPFHPHWVRECGNEETLHAMGRWFAARRDRWQGWGELAEEIGIEAFYAHMEGVLDAEPVEAVVGTTLTRLDDPRDIVVGEMLWGRDGQRIEPLHVHRFASAELRDRFWNWFHTGDNHQLAGALLNVGWNAGGDELSRVLNDLAANWSGPGRSQPRGRRRGKRRLPLAA